mgnify:CR=1 FL=1
MNTPHNFGRQGEIIIKPVASIPSKAKLVEEGGEIVVGHSESGHNHVMVAEQGVTIKMFELDGKVYLDLPRQVDLIHQKTVEKHETQTFVPGKYIREIRHSYSYGEKIMKRVQD